MRAGPLQEVGGYELLGPLGSGGSGTVYRARDADGRVVALKLLHPHLGADPDARERLAREVANLRRVRHPAIAQVLDAEIDAAEAFVVTELVPGVDLAAYVRTRGPLPPQELAWLADDLREALATVHAAGVLHRDLSPGNVMITDDGSPVLIDFGIAQAVGDVRVTSTGMVTGTPGYVAPELLEGGHPSAAGDWWGWAAVLAFAGTGRPPFGAGAPVAALAKARAGDVDLAGLDRRTATALRSALAADPWRRATPDAVCEDLARVAEGDVGDGAGDGSEDGAGDGWGVGSSGDADRAGDGVGTQVLRPAGGTRTTRAMGVGSGTRVLPAADARPGAEERPAGYPPDERPRAAYAPGAYPPAPQAPGAHPADTRPPGTWLPDGDPAADGVGPAAPPLPPRRSGTVLALALPLLALAVAWPLVALAAGLVAAVLVRSIGLAAQSVQRRRVRRGPRAGDAIGGLVAWPWYLARAVVGAVPSLAAAAAAAAGLWVAARWALERWVVAAPPAGEAAGVVPGNADAVGRAVLAAIVLAALAVAWFGPLARRTREGARWTLTVVGGGVAGAAALALALVAGSALLAALLVTHPVDWWPLLGVPGSR